MLVEIPTKEETAVLVKQSDGLLAKADKIFKEMEKYKCAKDQLGSIVDEFRTFTETRREMIEKDHLPVFNTPEGRFGWCHTPSGKEVFFINSNGITVFVE